MTIRENKHNERLAYHEAGHALVAIKLGYAIDRTTVERNEITGAEGETIAIPPGGNISTYLFRQLGITDEKADKDQIAYLMAGLEAVRLAGFEKTISIEGSELSDELIEARSDIFEATRIAERLGRGVKTFRDLEFQSGKSRATVTLEKNIAALNAIARALIERKTLSGVEVAKIVESHSRPKHIKRDRIPINTVCCMSPCAVFETHNDITLYELGIINGDWLAANSGQSHLWLPGKVNVKVLFHGPYQGHVAPDAPQSTRDALGQFEICQIQILNGSYTNKVGWVLDAELYCPT